jgi:hypothetical protein
MPIVEHSSGAILFDFYSAAEVVGAPPSPFFSVYFSPVCVQYVCVFPPYFLVGENTKNTFSYSLRMCEKKYIGGG